MKKSLLLLVAVMAIMALKTAYAQKVHGNGIEGRLIATIGDGESMVYNENCIMLDKPGENMVIVTKKSTSSSMQYFIYHGNRQKEGPLNQPDSNIWMSCGSTIQDNCCKFNPEQTFSVNDYVTGDYNSYMVKFKDKKFGPYTNINPMIVAPDNSNFFAVAISQDMKMHFIDGTGNNNEITGMPEEIIFSPDGRNAFLKVLGDFNPYDPEAMAKMADNFEAMANPKTFLYNINGTKQGPYETDDVSNIWFTVNNRFVLKKSNTVTVDGKLVFTTESYPNPCDIWISDDGTKYAWQDYEFLTFYDGVKAPFAFWVQLVNEGGQKLIKWVSLEDEKNLVVYQRPF